MFHSECHIDLTKFRIRSFLKWTHNLNGKKLFILLFFITFAVLIHLQKVTRNKDHTTQNISFKKCQFTTVEPRL